MKKGGRISTTHGHRVGLRLVGSILLIVAYTFAGTLSQSAAASAPSSTPAANCTETYFLTDPNSTTNLTFGNAPGGTLLVAANSQDVTASTGSIIFEHGPNYSILWSQLSGPLRYSFGPGKWTVGGMSCSVGASLHLIAELSDSLAYSYPFSNYSTLFVTAVCLEEAGCGAATLDGKALQPNQSTAGPSAYRIDFYDALVTMGEENVTTLNFLRGYSAVFVYSVSTNPFGRLVGTLNPRDTVVLVNGTRISTPGGTLNYTLHYGIYNLTFLARGHYNLSIVQAVYGGLATPVNVNLPSLASSRIAAIERLLAIVIPGLFVATAVAVGGIITFRRPSKDTKNVEHT